MIYVLAIIIILTLIIIFNVILIAVINSLLFKHDMTSHPKAVYCLHSIVRQNKLEEKIFFDLGCSWGTLSFKTSKVFPNLSIVAIDNDWYRIFVCRLKNFFLKRNINFVHSDLFDYDFSTANILFSYIWQTQLPKLEKKFLNEGNPGLIMITNETFFPNLKPEKIITLHPNKKNSEKVFIYKK